MSRTPKTNHVYCPHCDSNNEPYFSRSVPMGFYCRDCGKDVDEKQSDTLASVTEQRDRLAEELKEAQNAIEMMLRDSSCRRIPAYTEEQLAAVEGGPQ